MGPAERWRARGPHARILGLVAVGLIVGGVGMALTGASAAEARDLPSDTIITVTVAPSPADGGSTGGSGGGGGAGDSGSGTPGTDTPGTDTPSSSPSPSIPAGNSNALIAVGGLAASYVPSGDAAQQRVHLRLAVRNGSQSTLALSTKFWVTSPIGSTIGTAAPVTIEGLKPGKTRVMDVTISRLGQWTVLQAHATVTPPKVIDSQKVAPISRESFVIAPPLLLIGGGTIALLGGIISWFVWFRRPIMVAAASA